MLPLAYTSLIVNEADEELQLVLGLISRALTKMMDGE
jgi:hypothetical protein